MKSKAVGSFCRGYNRLPANVRKLALKQYKLWLLNPQHPSLHFKKVGLYWSARITEDFRAVGIVDKDTIVWFFIGSHSDYKAVIKNR